MLNLIDHLPWEAALWREQGRVPFPELFHEWMRRMLEFSAKGKTETPTMAREPSAATPEATPKRLETTDREQIADFFNSYIEG